MSDLSERLETLRQHVEPTAFLRIALIDDPQFTNADIEKACYVTATQLHNWVSRGWLRLTSATPGKGRRRLYTGRDAVAVALAAALQPFGMMQVAQHMIEARGIPHRAYLLLRGGAIPNNVVAITPTPEGDDWLFTQLGPETKPADLPCPGFVALEVDRLIIETLENLVRLLNDQEVPARSFPKKPTPEETEDEYLAFTGQAYRDEQGRRIFRGLTLEESAEFERLTDYEQREMMDRVESTERYTLLAEKNNRATAEYNDTRRGAE
jgi:hypothetical protein